MKFKIVQLLKKSDFDYVEQRDFIERLVSLNLKVVVVDGNGDVYFKSKFTNQSEAILELVDIIRSNFKTPFDKYIEKIKDEFNFKKDTTAKEVEELKNKLSDSENKLKHMQEEFSSLKIYFKELQEVNHNLHIENEFIRKMFDEGFSRINTLGLQSKIPSYNSFSALQSSYSLANCVKAVLKERYSEEVASKIINDALIARKKILIGSELNDFFIKVDTERDKVFEFFNKILKIRKSLVQAFEDIEADNEN